MDHDQLMLLGELGQRPRNVSDLVDLGRRVGALTATQQRIASERDHDTHFSLSGWRP